MGHLRGWGKYVFKNQHFTTEIDEKFVKKRHEKYVNINKIKSTISVLEGGVETKTNSLKITYFEAFSTIAVSFHDYFIF